MPRQPRLDIPDLVHHVIVRGIKRDKIFRDDDDRRDFLRRLHNLLTETETTCYAWALIPNHFHLLLRPCESPLSSFMRRLLTGYAVTFNKRHHRSGHLFQNRYKSIVCEEDVYLLELIRYVHLNPLRAGLVQDMAELDAYPWCGHAEVMGNRPSGGLDVESVLALFGPKEKPARRAYHQFVADGLEMGKRPELTGGGLRRSRALCATDNEVTDFDERVLGSGEFVSGLRERGLLDDTPAPTLPMSALQRCIEQRYQLDTGALQQRGRMNAVSEARCLFCFCAARLLRYSGAEIARYLKVGPPSVSRAVRKGERLVKADHVLKIGCIRP